MLVDVSTVAEIGGRAELPNWETTSGRRILDAYRASCAGRAKLPPTKLYRCPATNPRRSAMTAVSASEWT